MIIRHIKERNKFQLTANIKNEAKSDQHIIYYVIRTQIAI